MIGSASQDESDEVLAFLAQRRGPVLRDAITELAAAPVADLPAVVHRLHGVLGSYGLTDAHEQIAALSATLAEPGLDETTVDAARRQTVDALRAMAPEPVA